MHKSLHFAWQKKAELVGPFIRIIYHLLDLFVLLKALSIDLCNTPSYAFKYATFADNHASSFFFEAWNNICKSHSEENVIFKKLSFKFNAFKRCEAAVKVKIAAKMRGGRNIWSCASIWQKTFLSASGLWSWIICFSPKVQLSFHPFSCHWYIFL